MPFEENELCPTCHSRIDPNTENPERQKGEKEPLPEGTEVSSNTGEIPQWSNDPTLTLDGFSGEDFVSADRYRTLDIEEIQDARRQEEIDVGIPEDLRTEFTDITDQKSVKGSTLCGIT